MKDIIKTLTFFIFLVLLFGVFFGSSKNSVKNQKPKGTQETQSTQEAVKSIPPENSPQILEIETEKPETIEIPATIRAVYITSWSASRNDYINYLIDLAKNTEINAAVVDIKDWSGYIGYDTQVELAEKYGAESFRIKDIDSFVKKLHDEEIYVIGRIAVFQDPILARTRPEIAIHSQSRLPLDPFRPIFTSLTPFSLWLDRLGLAWIDPMAKENWDYNIAIAKDAISHGFDEINFDYVRFPSDGDLKDMVFPIWDGKIEKHLVIKDFFKYLREQLPGVRLSVDLFGLTCSSADDLGVGQIIEDAFGYFDYISPMIYPSHYAPGFLGFENPAEYPYEVINYSTARALQRLSVFKETQESNAQIRPWLQDFNMGAIYDDSMVRNEIQAVLDATGKDFNGFMLWNPSNYYTEGALLPD